MRLSQPKDEVPEVYKHILQNPRNYIYLCHVLQNQIEEFSGIGSLAAARPITQHACLLLGSGGVVAQEAGVGGVHTVPREGVRGFP